VLQNKDDPVYMREFYEILRQAANGDEYLQRLEEFIRKSQTSRQPHFNKQVVTLKERQAAIKVPV
jgi:anion-transporting  ArsA/GET3 family ATPase